MKRRDFLAVCAAAVGCAAVPARKATLTIHDGVWLTNVGCGSFTAGPPVKTKPWSLDDLPAGFKASRTFYG